MKLMSFDELQRHFKKKGFEICPPNFGFSATINHKGFTQEQYRSSPYRKLFKAHRSIVRKHFGLS